MSLLREQEVKELTVWCSLNNLELNTHKTVEIIICFWIRHFLFVADACFVFELRQVIYLLSIFYLKIQFYTP